MSLATNELLFPQRYEEALIGALLIGRQLDQVVGIIEPTDILNAEYRALYRLMLSAWESGGDFDPLTLAASPDTPDLEHIQTLAYGSYSSSGLPRYAQHISQASQLRAVQHAIGTVATAIDTGLIGDPGEAVRTITEQAATILRDNSTDPAPVPMSEFLEQVAADPVQHEWLLPGLIRRRWRIVIAGEEGIGKMVLLRQIGHCLAAGVHPFKPDHPVIPRRVLVVDVENPADTIDNQTALISNQHDLVGMAGDRLQIYSREAGMNLASSADRRRFERAVQHAAPDVVIAGPLYKLSRRATGGKSDWDADAMDLINFFDDLRTRHGCALILEHHLVKGSGNAHIRSTDQGGSAMFRRWPEMSFSMVEDMDSHAAGDLVKLHRYRRGRNEDVWPDRVRRRPSGASQTGFAWLPEYDR